MLVIDHRRHTMRVKSGDHLSQAGVDLARRAGETMERYDIVVTSPVARAFETAIAMGFAVDEQWSVLFAPREVADEVNWEKGCAEYARAARLGGATARYLADLAEAFQSLAGRLPEGGRALVVSHGGVIEAATVACLPDKDYSGWDTSCGYCEGVRFHLTDGAFTDAEVLTVRNA
ncbi:MAG TPA: histidine phosphatase family protein [Chloroflexota bacterium]|nr:histidine phosphatase family protein [Chloroflexota bacterium]